MDHCKFTMLIRIVWHVFVGHFYFLDRQACLEETAPFPPAGPGFAIRSYITKSTIETGWQSPALRAPRELRVSFSV